MEARPKPADRPITTSRRPSLHPAWMATFEPYALGQPIGYGATEDEAVADLKSKEAR